MAFLGFLLIPFFASFPTEVAGPMLYLLHRGEAEKALSSYLEFAQESKEHDFALLQQAAKVLLEQGIDSKDEEVRLLCIYGAGIATSSDLYPILAKGLRSNDLKIQLTALSYLSKLQDDEADLFLLEALSSPFLMTRFEALFQLAKKNHPAVLGHLHSLMIKVPEEVRPLFAQIAVHLEGLEATRCLKNLLFDPCVDVRIETILTLIDAKRDDFLPNLRTLSWGSSYAQLESCARAFGKFKDHFSLERLKELVLHQEKNIQLAAAISLYELGEGSFLKKIEEAAREGSLFAIASLGQLNASSEILFQLAKHSERDIRLNATLALLTMRDPRVLKCLEEFLLEEGRDLGFFPIHSPGGTLTAWRAIPSATYQEKNYPGILGYTAEVREKILVQSVEFEEEDFLKLASQIMLKRQNSLIPTLMELLLNLKSEGALALLKKGHQKAGAPLMRNYCTLALYRLNVNGPYEEHLINWIKEQGNTELIRFKEEGETPPFSHPHELTPQETSLFLVDVCETLASTQNEKGIEALLYAIAYGNPKNRYALAGLLMRTTE
jgi:HEAT repeat protein